MGDADHARIPFVSSEVEKPGQATDKRFSTALEANGF